MEISSNQLRELIFSISDRIYIKVEKWNLYLGDAGLSEALAIECNANLDLGPKLAAEKALDSVQVRFGGGETQIPLSKLVPSSQIFELEEILDPYCR